MEEHWSTILANLTTSLGILGFIFYYVTHRLTQDQFKFTVMVSCIERYQKLSPLIKVNPEDSPTLLRYVDLTNEEFFYFQRGYIPKEVMVEWLDTIVEYFPVYINGQDEPINYKTLEFKKIHLDRLLRGYPRLQKAFTLDHTIDFSDKVKLIKAVGRNLNIKLSDKHFRDALYI